MVVSFESEKHLTKLGPEIRPVILIYTSGRAGFEPAKPCTPNRQSSDVRKSDQRSYVSEDLRRSIQAELRRNDLNQSRAVGFEPTTSGS